MRKIFPILAICLAGLTIWSSAAGGVITLPNPLCPNMQNPCVSSPTCICNFNDLIARISQFIFTIIGALAVLMFLIAGIMFVISAGNPEKIGTAKKIAIYAAIGLAIALAGNGLIQVVQEVITGN